MLINGVGTLRRSWLSSLTCFNINCALRIRSVLQYEYEIEPPKSPSTWVICAKFGEFGRVLNSYKVDLICPLHLRPIGGVGLIFIANPWGQWLLCLFENVEHAKGSHIKWRPDIISARGWYPGSCCAELGIAIWEWAKDAKGQLIDLVAFQVLNLNVAERQLSQILYYSAFMKLTWITLSTGVFILNSFTLFMVKAFQIDISLVLSLFFAFIVSLYSILQTESIILFDILFETNCFSCSSFCRNCHTHSNMFSIFFFAALQLIAN